LIQWKLNIKINLREIRIYLRDFYYFCKNEIKSEIMSLETLHILMNIILIFSGLYIICIGAFTFGIYNISNEEKFHNAIYKKVSILIAAKNEESNILKPLQSLVNQSFEKSDFEIIVVDDNSTDKTFDVVSDFMKTNPELKIRLVKTEGNGKKQAISQALHLAENEIVMVTDADCELPHRWIETTVDFMIKNDLKMVLGPVLLSPCNTFFEKLQVLEHLSLIASTAGSASIGMPVMCNGANMAYDRKSALEVEKYRTDMKIASGDDVFLMEQFVKHFGSRSVKFLMDENAIVKTQAMPDLKSFFRQRRRWVSKTKAYTSWKIIVTALIVLMFNLSIVALFIGGFLHPAFFPVFALFTLMKFMVDYPILRKVTDFMKQQQLMKWAFPLEFIYPFYVVFTAFSGLFAKVKWK